MTVTKEIENAIRKGAEPMFLIGLIEATKEGMGDSLIQRIDRIATKIHKEVAHA